MNEFEMWGIGTAIFVTVFFGGLYGYDKLKHPEPDEDEQSIIRNSRINGGKRKRTKKNKRV